MYKIKKILIANRGEIALRIMRSAKEMGISTVAIFSNADRNALHVKFADEAVCVGPPPSSQSYLLGDRIIEICKDIKADAIHPGYGFLSENAEFARKTSKAGIIFIGPSPESIKLMGNKLTAKKTILKYNVPVVPGIEQALTSIDEAKEKAKQIGYPVLIKASAGGGGKGMRVVENEKDLEEQMNRAISEAKSAFGDGSVFIEKYIDSPRHVEIQILGDKHGNIIHLFERECTIQRRHQKVIEEAPSPVLNDEIRAAMGKCAIDVAKACNYFSAGTVEFLVVRGPEGVLSYYFLEMNTRLQVEHPVTEQITGIDIVKEQIKIAQDEHLNIKQEDLSIRGHAIEVRVYAENPANNFLPDTGKLTTYKTPQGPGIRVDDGFEQGMEISIYYDPMIAKLITHAATRAEAIEKMKRAIDEYQITGVETTLPFGKFVMDHKAFRSGEFDTHFVEKHFKVQSSSRVTRDKIQSSKFKDKSDEIAGILAGYLVSKKSDTLTIKSVKSIKNKSNWRKNRMMNEG